MRNCRARQFSDSMSCVRCELSWDMNDPQPPKCKYPPHNKIKSPAPITLEKASVKFMDKVREDFENGNDLSWLRRAILICFRAASNKEKKK